MPPLTPLLRPERFFVERELDGLRVLAVVLVLTAAGPATVYAVGWILTDHIDGTVLVDNPERPPDRICESESDVFDQSGCDQPREVERNADSVIWSAMHDLLGAAIVAGPLVWVVAGFLLHVGSLLGGDDGGVSTSFAVAAWGLVPQVVGGIVILLLLSATFKPVTVTPEGTTTAVDAAQRQVEALQSAKTVVAVVTAVWSAIIWRYGLKHERGVEGMIAWGTAGLVAALLAVGGLI